MKEFKLGDTLCDMHDGFKYLDKSIRAINSIHMRVDDAAELVKQILKNIGVNKLYINKMLVLVENNLKMIGVYAYDDRYFGMVQLEYVSPA